MRHERLGQVLLGGAPSLPMWWKMASDVGMLCVSTGTCYSHCGICPNAWNHVSLCHGIHGILLMGVGECLLQHEDFLFGESVVVFGEVT